MSDVVGRGYPQSDLNVLNGLYGGNPTFRLRPAVASFNDEVSGLTGSLGVVGQGPTIDTGTNWLTFDGNNDYVAYSDDGQGQFNPGTEWTLEAEIEPSSLASATSCVFARNSIGDSRYYLHLLSTGVIRFGASKFGGTLLESAASAITVSSQYHIAVTREGSTWTLWVEGVAVDTATWASAPDASLAGNFRIGADPLSLGSTYFTGKIGRVKLTPELLYDAPFVPPSRGTM
jgi:hypothetical protein